MHPTIIPTHPRSHDTALPTLRGHQLNSATVLSTAAPLSTAFATHFDPEAPIDLQEWLDPRARQALNESVLVSSSTRVVPTAG